MHVIESKHVRETRRSILAELELLSHESISESTRDHLNAVIGGYFIRCLREEAWVDAPLRSAADGA